MFKRHFYIVGILSKKVNILYKLNVHIFQIFFTILCDRLVHSITDQLAVNIPLELKPQIAVARVEYIYWYKFHRTLCNNVWSVKNLFGFDVHIYSENSIFLKFSHAVELERHSHRHSFFINREKNLQITYYTTWREFYINWFQIDENEEQEKKPYVYQLTLYKIWFILKTFSIGNLFYRIATKI